MNKKKILLASVFATSALSAVGFVQLASTSNISNNISKTDSSLDVTSASTKATASGLKNLATETQNAQISIPTSYYQQNSFKNLSNDNGPILLFDEARSFGATDWYGNPAWYITLNSASGQNNGYYSAAWFSTSTSSAIDFTKAGTKVVDWAYNHKTDNLYVLTDTQYLIIVSSKTGTIVSTSEVGNSVDKIQIIDFNNSVYLWNSKTTNPQVLTIEPQTGMVNSAKITSTFLSSKHLFALIPLDVNYTIAVTSTSQVTDTNGNVNFSLDFVNDDLNQITSSKTQSVSLTGTKASDIYINGFKRNSDYVIFIQNKIYSVSLNKSLMSNSTFTDLLSSSNSNLGGFSITTGSINSAFIDVNNQIYFKTTESKEVNTMLVSNSFNKMDIPTTLGATFAGKEENAKTTQIFPVLSSASSSSDNLISRSYTGYLLSSNGFIGTGFLNGSVISNQFTSQSSAPSFNVSNAGSSSIPSGVNSTNITKNNTSLSNVTLETSNAILIADDISGTLYVKVPYTLVGSWYGNGSQTSEFNSRGFLIGKFTFTNIQTATTWASNLPADIARLEPSQISTDILKRNATSIVSIPSSVLALQNSNLNINFAIVTKNDNAGQITLKATVTYKNAYGSIVSYAMANDKQYTVKKAAATYAFAFAGQTDADKPKVDKSSSSITDLLAEAQSVLTNGSEKFLTVDVGTLEGNLTQYANVLPSLWNPNSVNDYFITTKDKYPNNPTITLFPDDENGNIVIVVQYNNLSNNTPSKFAIRYTGITNYAKSSVRFQGSRKTDLLTPSGTSPFPSEQNNILDVTTVSGFSDYGTKLVSDVSPNEFSTLYSSNLINYMGFTPEVTFVQEQNGSEGTTTYDSEYGSFLLKIDFSKSVSSNLLNAKDEYIPFSETPFANQLGLKDGVIYQRYAGLLPIGSTYNISIDRNSTSYRSLIANNNVNAALSSTDILSILTINGYDSSQGDTITIFDYRWNGETFEFTVYAKSSTYDSISTTQTFGVSWSPKFASIRNMSLSVAVITSVVGITLVSLAIALYIVRRNKIRRLLK
ncbi:conserved hypothetical protein [Malacoplasma penetrans HF-2]|uniref:Uncharacterized protein n=1 Tax=Malacoplasma penetrans (strain HF-2) TaxID=272633 RepID=Q8EV01_MALP2|nr:hypothetical protein [Malacoplasma penetrans]BAC44560.1 conserved hypothetical protein [Malacoplasma penetrans HF-2]